MNGSHLSLSLCMALDLRWRRHRVKCLLHAADNCVVRLMVVQWVMSVVSLTFWVDATYW